MGTFTHIQYIPSDDKLEMLFDDAKPVIQNGKGETLHGLLEIYKKMVYHQFHGAAIVWMVDDVIRMENYGRYNYMNIYSCDLPAFKLTHNNKTITCSLSEAFKIMLGGEFRRLAITSGRRLDTWDIVVMDYPKNGIIGYYELRELDCESNSIGSKDDVGDYYAIG